MLREAGHTEWVPGCAPVAPATQLEVIDETAGVVWLEGAPLIVFTKKGILLTTDNQKSEAQRQAINDILNSILFISPEWVVSFFQAGTTQPFHDGIFFKT